ncbi:MAG TPA: DUF6252 family protein [Mucilaginibacter sp.]|nr:DUF6252 family protein [Mucilaginibacter sp.]
MNKLRLFVFLLAAGFLIQSCTKDTQSAVAFSNQPFQANINGTSWVPDTVSTTITYNPADQSKTFYCSGQKNQKQVIFSVKLNNSTNTPGFATGTFNIDSVNVFAQYNVQQLNGSGNLVFVPHGAVKPGSGSIVITSVDSVKKQISGTFSFYSRSTQYDNQGNVISTTVDNITAGQFENLPYQFYNNQ